ncbi:Hypothetical protein mma_0434 [Janthinobacterium sp. Marseille]|nr:Hypothetical protein mma_0434 [Janthinobacterium sp. Marseille]
MCEGTLLVLILWRQSGRCLIQVKSARSRTDALVLPMLVRLAISGLVPDKMAVLVRLI